MLDRFLDKKRNLYALAIVAIVFESLSSTVLKLGGQYPFLSAGYLFFFCLAVGIMALYAVAAATDDGVSAEGADLCADLRVGGGVLP